MIIDNIRNAKLYMGLNKNFAAMAEYASANDIMTLAPGRYEVDGEKVFLLQQQFETKDYDADRYEAHSKYIDVQIIVEGTEYMWCSDTAKLKLLTPYSSENDISWYHGDEGTMVKLTAGDFIMFFPDDAHMPCRHAIGGSPGKVKKAVFKIRVW